MKYDHYPDNFKNDRRNSGGTLRQKKTRRKEKKREKREREKREKRERKERNRQKRREKVRKRERKRCPQDVIGRNAQN